MGIQISFRHQKRFLLLAVTVRSPSMRCTHFLIEQQTSCLLKTASMVVPEARVLLKANSISMKVSITKPPVSTCPIKKTPQYSATTQWNVPYGRHVALHLRVFLIVVHLVCSCLRLYRLQNQGCEGYRAKVLRGGVTCPARFRFNITVLSLQSVGM